MSSTNQHAGILRELAQYPAEEKLNILASIAAAVIAANVDDEEKAKIVFEAFGQQLMFNLQFLYSAGSR